MAVDTEAKRWSMLGFASGVGRNIVFNPDTSGLVSIEKITVLKHYGGIAWDEAAIVEPEAAAANTGGWATSPLFRRYRDDEDVRRERIALGILPPDLPAEDVEAVKEAARESVEALAQRKLKTLTDDADRLSGLLADLVEAQRQAEIEAREAMIESLMASRIEAVTMQQRDRNAAATLVMLSLI